MITQMNVIRHPRERSAVLFKGPINPPVQIQPWWALNLASYVTLCLSGK